MQITVDIEDHVFALAGQLAHAHGVSAEDLMAALLSEALAKRQASVLAAMPVPFQPFPQRGTPVTNELVNQIRDAEGV